MNIFGIQILTKRGQAKLEHDMKCRATGEMVEFLRNNKNKIILDPKIIDDKTISEPLTIIGNSQLVTNCIFTGIDGAAVTFIQGTTGPLKSKRRKQLKK